MKGIILAGGMGTRLYPSTVITSKILLPIYDKPMIYYPLVTLMNAGIKDIAIITNPLCNDDFIKLLGDGSQFGISITYIMQYVARGIADSFILAEEFAGKNNVALILGDNLFVGENLNKVLNKARKLEKGAIISGYPVTDPERFGVAEVAENGSVVSIEEKPQNPKSNLAVTGLYFYDSSVFEIAKNLTPSARGELEITDVNIEYMKRNQLSMEIIDEEVAWIDTGTPDSLLEAANYIQKYQKENKTSIAVPEVIAYENGFITEAEFRALASELGAGHYGDFVREYVANIKESCFA